MISLWAHPRSRGDHLWVPPSIFRVAGSSPLARGPHGAQLVLDHGTGLIPARAGTTQEHVGSALVAGAHPRSRGDHILELFGLACGWGSSPLARGPRYAGSDLLGFLGLIPARAGTTLHHCTGDRCRGAHPRSRGDHVVLSFLSASQQGSSPLARGPLMPPQNSILALGLIPARAGTTRILPHLWLARRAHPRSRGDHVECVFSAAPAEGSSPLARGPPKATCRACASTGLIPARAGTTPFVHAGGVVVGAHPRSRGDHAVVVNALMMLLGSSPLARGPRLGAG